LEEKASKKKGENDQHFSKDLPNRRNSKGNEGGVQRGVFHELLLQKRIGKRGALGSKAPKIKKRVGKDRTQWQGSLGEEDHSIEKTEKEKRKKSKGLKKKGRKKNRHFGGAVKGKRQVTGKISWGGQKTLLVLRTRPKRTKGQ